MRAQFVFSEIRTDLRRNLTMTVALVLILFIALSMFGVGLLTHRQVSTMKGVWYDKVEVSVFLCTDGDKATDPSGSCAQGEATQAQKDQIRTDLQGTPEVKTIYFENHQQAYAQFRKLFKDQSIVDTITPTDLPESFRVKLTDPSKVDVLTSKFTGRPGIKQVVDQRKAFQGLFAILGKVQTMVSVVAIIGVVAAVLLIATMMRVAAFTRRRETGIMRLVGASNLYIQLPFILESVLAAVVGAALTVAALAGGMSFLVYRGFRQYANVFGYVSWADLWDVMPWILGFGIVLSALTSFVTLRRFLRV